MPSTVVYSLQRFFGTIRQAGGQNDHPATPTFLQLYKLLSVYSVLKPPKYGNCSVHDDKPLRPLISISDIKDVFMKGLKSPPLLEELKQKLDGLIEHEEWDFSDVVEHDYTCAPVVDCVIYYVTGYLCRQVSKYSKCETCRNAFVAPLIFSQHSEAQLVNCKTMGGLIHPNIFFYKFVREIETAFNRFASSVTVYDEVLTYLIDHCHFSFPCIVHKSEVVAYTVKYYITMRMRQYSFQKNNNMEMINKTKKKIAKFTSS